MQNSRQQLTFSYTVALAGTMAVFGLALYLERHISAEREQQNQVRERLAVEARLVTGFMETQIRRGASLTVTEPTLGTATDTSTQLASEIRSLLDGLQDYSFVVDRSGVFLYVSPPASDFDPLSLSLVSRELRRLSRGSSSAELLLDEGAPFLFVMDSLPPSGPGGPRAILIAGRADGPPTGPGQLLVSMVLFAPLILGASAVMGAWLARRAHRSLRAMIAEVEAIQDGRSLHRRVAAPSGRDDELARMGATLNAMLGRIEGSFVALRRFTADASHELKTPLMVLRAGVERALTHPDTPPEVVASLDETLRQINEMTDLVTNLLTLARVDEGRAALVMAPVDLRALISDAAETAEILGEDGGVEVILSLPSERVTVQAEAGRVRQLLLNLITNAVKYTPAGGTVQIVLAHVGSHAVIEVRDSGIGIATGDIPHLFERFWRADQARSRTGDRPGAGLGLAIARWVVDAHGWEIDVQSRPGRGTTFQVTVPLLDRKADVPASPAAG